MPPAPDDGAEAVRFLDILTTASSLARALGADAVSAVHLRDAIAALTGEAPLEDAGASGSPLGHRRAELAAAAPVRELSQRWFERLGRAPEATLSAGELAALRAEVEALVRS